MRLLKRQRNGDGAAGPGTGPPPTLLPALEQAVPMPRWILALRALQALLALLVLGLVGYAEHVYWGSYVRVTFVSFRARLYHLLYTN